MNSSYSFPPILFGDLSYVYICRRCVILCDKANEASDNPSIAAAASDEDSDETKQLSVKLEFSPSLIGNLVYDELKMPFFSGKWAMKDEEHAAPEKTGEFKLTLKGESCDQNDLNGPYDGSFTLKLKDGKEIKVDDHMDLIFLFSSPEIANVTGNGRNKFGNFEVQGTLVDKSKLHIYKIFSSTSTEKKRRREPEVIVQKQLHRSRSVDISTYSTTSAGSYIRRLDKDWLGIVSIALVHLTVIANADKTEISRWFSFEEIIGCLYYNWLGDIINYSHRILF